MRYRRKIFIYFVLIFIGFTFIVMLLQLNREKEYKIDSLRSDLNTYVDIIHNYMEVEGIDSTSTILKSLPSNLRVTIVTKSGVVYFDNTLSSAQERALENHLHRPEILTAKINGVGSSIRYSATNKIDYYYYAKDFAPFFIRVAIPYDLNLKERLKADKYFLYFIVILFLSSLLILLYVSDKLGRAISGLNEFLKSVENKNPKYDKIKFPDTEVGEIGHKIVETYALLESRNSELDNEREKILRHFHYLDEGISIYSSDKKSIYANTHFIQLLNTIIDEPSFNVDVIFTSEEFTPMVEFLDANLLLVNESNSLPVWQGKINKGGNHFAIQLVIYQDSSFEVTLNNISLQEKNRLIKHEMTNNIAHELRTPVSTISGYVETLLSQENIDDDRRKYYIERMDIQVKRLTELIRDIALITKTEEAPQLFHNEPVSISGAIEEILMDFNKEIETNKVAFNSMVSEKVVINGNHTLLYAIFRNLIENAIKYGGEKVEISITNYAEDNNFYYFKLSDTGIGVAEEHLNRLFDRFYRVNYGRSRKSGGSGLGLSIVKNAIKFHGGEITAKSRVSGGLEFVFSLKKTI